MKKIFTTCVFLIGFSIFAQEAGKAGELLKNEAKNTEMQTQKKEVLGNRTNQPMRNGNSGMNNNSPDNPRNYQWNYNYGYSEVFLRIPERGYFTVEIGDQILGNATGKFRFFDLPSGRIPVSIYENGYLLYRTQLNVRNNYRMVLDFFTSHGLYLLDNVPVRNQTYGFNNWDDVWNNPYGNGNSGFGNGNFYGNVMDDRDFNDFIAALRKNNFDDGKIDFVRQQIRNNGFSSQQIKSILNTFSFEDKKLEAAKTLYKTCVDKNNFYTVYEIFSFEKSKRDLMRFVSNS